MTGNVGWQKESLFVTSPLFSPFSSLLYFLFYCSFLKLFGLISDTRPSEAGCPATWACQSIRARVWLKKSRRTKVTEWMGDQGDAGEKEEGKDARRWKEAICYYFNQRNIPLVLHHKSQKTRTWYLCIKHFWAAYHGRLTFPCHFKMKDFDTVQF